MFLLNAVHVAIFEKKVSYLEVGMAMFGWFVCGIALGLVLGYVGNSSLLISIETGVGAGGGTVILMLMLRYYISCLSGQGK